MKLMKKVLLSALVLLLFTSQSIDAQSVKSKSKAKPVLIEVNDFHAKAPELVGQTVEIKGMVAHVCKHGGEKMFIMSGNPEIQVKIVPADNVAAFPPELEGSTIEVKGIIEVIEEDMPKSDEEHEDDEEHEGMYHKKQYSILCQEYQVIEK